MSHKIRTGKQITNCEKSLHNNIYDSILATFKCCLFLVICANFYKISEIGLETSVMNDLKITPKTFSYYGEMSIILISKFVLRLTFIRLYHSQRRRGLRM